jgi:hypothetical protein
MKARREYLFNTILLVVFATVMVIFGFTMEFNFGLPMSGPITGLIMNSPTTFLGTPIRSRSPETP